MELLNWQRDTEWGHFKPNKNKQNKDNSVRIRQSPSSPLVVSNCKYFPLKNSSAVNNWCRWKCTIFFSKFWEGSYTKFCVLCFCHTSGSNGKTQSVCGLAALNWLNRHSTSENSWRLFSFKQSCGTRSTNLVKQELMTVSTINKAKCGSIQSLQKW